MTGELERQTGMWGRIMKGLLMVVAFVGVSAMFTVVLRPLAQSSAATGDETAAAGPSQTAARAEPIEAAIPEPLGPPPLPERPKIAIPATAPVGEAQPGVTAIQRLPPAYGVVVSSVKPTLRERGRSEESRM